MIQTLLRQKVQTYYVDFAEVQYVKIITNQQPTSKILFHISNYLIYNLLKGESGPTNSAQQPIDLQINSQNRKTPLPTSVKPT